MAAQTAATTLRENVGSLTLHVFTFTSVTGADTFASGLPNIIGAWCNSTFNSGTTTTGASASVNFDVSTGIITFSSIGTAASPVTLYTVSKT